MTKIFAILNVTSNSFSDGNLYFNAKKAISRIEELFLLGADYIDIGAQSTAYGAEILSPLNEWHKLEPILKTIKDKSKVSIDTFNYENMLKAYELGFKIFNDVKGGQNSNILNFVAAHSDIKYISMFSLTIPANKTIRINNTTEIYEWIKKKLKQYEEFKIDPTQIIMDPGIGFVTTPEQSFEVIRNVEKLTSCGIKIMIGHSRKSFLKVVSNFPPPERDLETTIASLYLYNKVDYIRVHNVEMHKRAFAVWSKLNT